jgi:hypothetical protein
VITNLRLLLGTGACCLCLAFPLRGADTNAAAAAQAVSNLPFSLAFSNSRTNLSSVTDSAQPLVVEHADNLEYFRVDGINEDIIRLAGSIVLTYGRVRLKADRISVNMKTRLVYGRGRVQIRESGRTMIGEGFFYDLRRERGIVYRGASVIDRILYRGEEIKTLDEDFYRITDGLFSTCGYERPHYYLEAKKLWIYPDRSFFILHLFYRTGGVRIFYFPFAFRTKKGTGIHSYGGYSSTKGYYLQNSYPFGIGRLVDANLSADYYQFLGPYAGLRLGSKTKGSDAAVSLHYALQRTLLTNGRYDSVSRWLGSAREDLTLGNARSGIFRLQAYYFASSDNLFTSDYLVDRNTKSGLGLPGLGRLQPSRQNSYVNQDSRYVDVSHSWRNLQLSLRTRWDLVWNDARGRYVTARSSLPAFDGRYGGTLVAFRVSSNASAAERLLDILANRFAWSAGASLNNTEYFDQADGGYAKTERARDLRLGLSKDFNFFNFFVYSPRLTLGDVRWSGQSLTSDEEGNFRARSFSYLQWSEGWSLNMHAFWRRPVLTSSVNVGRRFQSEIFAPADRLRTGYGLVKAHNISMSWNLAVAPPAATLLPTLRYGLSTSADLMTLTNARLDPFDRERYAPLQHDVSFSWGTRLSLLVQDTWTYSLREGHSLRNWARARLSYGPISGNLSWMNNYDNVRQNILTGGYSVSFAPFPSFRLSLSVDSRNENLFVYDRELLRRFGYPSSYRRDFFSDLADSFNFFDLSKRKSSFFKLQGISVSFTHDLHCWELKGGYSLRQSYLALPYLRYARYPYWEHSVWVQIDLKAYQAVRYRKEETTAAPRTE